MNFKKIILTVVLSLVLMMPVGVNAKEFKNQNNMLEINSIMLNSTKMFENDNQDSDAVEQYNFDESEWDLCSGTHQNSKNALKVFKFIGNILKVAFILIPIVLIIMGSIDFMKATVAGKEDDIKKAQSTFIKRLIAAVIVFLVPLITNIIMGTVLNVTETNNCLNCVVNPNSCNTN